jgi:predicted porin
MKKFTILMAAIALVCFSVPAMAVDWNFYGNARMATFYTSEDQKDVGDKSTDFRWDFQGNSRLGANVKADHIKGQVELGLSGGDGNGDGSDGSVTTRRAYGVWNFGAGSFKVGKDYSPVSQFVSAQVFDGDAGLIGFGAPYGGRPGQAALTFGGFDLALINPKIDQSLEDPLTGTDANGTGQAKRLLPKIEASWGMGFDAWNFKLFGGYQYYSIKNVESLVNPGSTDDIAVTSYIVGGSGMFNFGPAYVGGQLMYGQNMGDARWSGGAFDNATWDGDDDTNDVVTYGGILVVGMKVSDMLNFEGGFGYITDDPNDAPNGFDEKTKAYDVYVQSVVTLAPGVYIIPEVGYRDFGNTPEDEDQGNQMYLGAKWQIDF